VQIAFALLRVSLASLGDRFEVVTVALLLAAVQIVINGRTVADQGAGKLISQDIQGYARGSTLNDDVAGDLGSGEDV
jgi:hypothetical protein